MTEPTPCVHFRGVHFNKVSVKELTVDKWQSRCNFSTDLIVTFLYYTFLMKLIGWKLHC